jgi:3-methyladenine DNA glycosylase AlkD
LLWLSSPDRWRRRIAVVSTLAWNQKARGGTGNAEKTLMVCEKAVDDHDDMVQKALSWALRELSKRDKEPVHEFMEKHWDRLTGRVRREVMNKLETGKKNP